MIIASILLAIYLRESMTFLPPTGDDVENVLVPAAPFIGFLWFAILGAGGAHSPRQWGFGINEYRLVVNLSGVTIMVIALFAFLLNYPLSRGFVVALIFVGIPLIALGRFVARRVLHRLRASGRQCTRTLIAGHLDAADDLVEVLRREPWLGYTPVGLTVDADETRASAHGVPVVGDYRNLIQAIDDTRAQAVIFTSGAIRRGREFNEMARLLEAHHAEMMVVPAMTDISAQRIRSTPVAGLPLMHVGKPQALRSLRFTKRAFDLLFATSLLLLGSPFLILIALIVKLGDGGSVFFKQPRVGVHGELFNMFKFRSMVPNADKMKKDPGLLEANEGNGALFKIRNDPRITPIGRFLRRYSIDELPQLINVVRGEMSLVGPRPSLPEEVETYDRHVRRRLDVRPGMTGLWQVSGRSDLSWEDTVRLDLYYVDNWSLLQDLAIVIRTGKAVLSSSGAY